MITIKNHREFDFMRKAGAVLAELFLAIQPKIVPGVTTHELDKFAEEFIQKKGAIPAFKGYHGFPATLCTSVNDEVVHGIPGKKVIHEGDIIGVDVGCIVNGFYADAARTYAIGVVTQQELDLIETTRDALKCGIEQVKVGNQISDISHAIQKRIQKKGYGIVRQYVGHGIGKSLHEEPQIPNFGHPKQGAVIQVGMAFAIEPMVNMGKEEVVVAEDGWTVVTKDGKKSAHFENTIIVTEKGREIITEITNA